MSFFGMSKEGKNARNAMKESAGRLTQTAATDQARSGAANAQGDALSQEVLAKLRDRYKKGFGTQAEVTAAGKEVMPGLDKSLATQSGRLQTVANDYNALAPVSATAASTGNRLDQLAAANGATGNTVQTNLNNTQEWLKNNADSNYQAAIARIAPGSALQEAEMARSYAPAVAAASQRLRSMGIDANSPEAQALLTNVEQGRATAMDTVAREGIDKQNALQLAQYNENAKNANAYTGASNAEANRVYGNQADVTGAQVNNDLVSRNMATQDVFNKGAIASGQNAQDQYGTGAQLERNQQGVNQIGRNVEQQNAATQGTAQQEGQQYGNALQWGGQGQNADTSAANINNTIYGREAANANWGGKLVGGLAAGAMNYFLPGSSIWKPKQQQQPTAADSGF